MGDECRALGVDARVLPEAVPTFVLTDNQGPGSFCNVAYHPKDPFVY